MSNHRGLMAALLAAGALAASGAQAATTVSSFFDAENDCAGYFGDSFDACTIFIDDSGQEIQISPVIAKFNGNLTLSETNDEVFPTIDGSEFGFSNMTSSGPDMNITGDWSYNQGTDDPFVRYWVAKDGNDFTLFWTVDDSALVSGGACFGLSDPYTLNCLNEALTVSSGSWSTSGGQGLSHLTFYDSDDPFFPPSEIPVPAAVWLFGSGLIGLVGIARRRKTV